MHIVQDLPLLVGAVSLGRLYIHADKGDIRRRWGHSKRHQETSRQNSKCHTQCSLHSVPRPRLIYKNPENLPADSASIPKGVADQMPVGIRYLGLNAIPE
jgi:hypothetical protein